MGYGIKFSTVVNRIMRDYDHNNNGSIDYRGNEGIRKDKDITYDPKTDIHTKEEITLTNRQLFKDADKNNNGFVSRKELTNLLKSFDLNNNGKLDLRSFDEWVLGENNDKAEYKKFLKTYREEKI